ncbi:hypothetical protein [Deinococcus pimensis]|uniref:hypothetical protein n=1 Tax=Deinococcus pimensis TaxID=309888 RepID=UPI0004804AB5|nr:hypothetical protein [Deinococcus pimensis]
MDDQTTPTPPPYTRLSELLTNLPTEQRTRFLTHYRHAIHTGRINAVILTERFTLPTSSTRHPTRHTTRHDEAILLTPDTHDWLHTTRTRTEQETRRARSTGAGRIAITLDELHSGQHDLTALTQANRQLKTPESSPRKKPKRKRQPTPGGRKPRGNTEP